MRKQKQIQYGTDKGGAEHTPDVIFKQAPSGDSSPPQTRQEGEGQSLKVSFKATPVSVEGKVEIGGDGSAVIILALILGFLLFAAILLFLWL